jgi:hypothetical protein
MGQIIACGERPAVPSDHSAEALGALLDPCTLEHGHGGDHRNALAVWVSSTSDGAREGSDAPSACETCQDFAERLAEAFSARDMSKHTDLRVEHARHLADKHANWGASEAQLYGPNRDSAEYDDEAPGNAFSWRGRMWP